MGINDYAILADVDFIAAGIVGLAFILVVVLSILSAKFWHWTNVVFLILSFLAGTFAVMGMAKVGKLRQVAIKEFDDAQKRLDRLTKEVDLQISGAPDSLTYSPGSLRAVSEELSRERAGRGRVWSGGLVEPEGDLQKFTFAAPRQPDFLPLQNVTLYAFLERQVGDQMYPALYIGSVRVNSESAESVVVEPVALAAPQEFVQPSGPWTLFERMPLDRRGVFKAATIDLVSNNPNASPEYKTFVQDLQDDSKPLDIGFFRQLLMNDYLPAGALGLDPTSREYEALIDNYAFDEQSLGRIQNWIDENAATRIATRFEPAPEEVFVRYRFNSKSKKPVQVDASSGNVETDGLFSPLGEAIDQAIQLGRQVEFAKGDEVLVDLRSAEGYQRGEKQIPPFKQDEDVIEVDRIFVRQVHDFPYEFKYLRLQASKALAEAEKVMNANAVQAETLANAAAQIDVRQSLTSRLESDRGNLTNDLTVISELAAEKGAEVESLKGQVAVAEQKIAEAYKQLREMAVLLSRQAFANR